MPKKFFVVKQITRKEYFAMAEAAGMPENPKIVDATDGGSMKTDSKTYLAYVEGDESQLEIPLED